MTEILLKVALNSITHIIDQMYIVVHTNVVYKVQTMPTATNDPHRLIPVTESKNIEL